MKNFSLENCGVSDTYLSERENLKDMDSVSTKITFPGLDGNTYETSAELREANAAYLRSFWADKN